MIVHVERLKVLFGGEWVGTLALTTRSNIIFEYSASWLKSGFDLAPRSLEFNAHAQVAKDSLFGGLHGVFNDSLPDGWGLLLMDRFLNERCGWSRHQISPLDRLAYIGTRAMGALSYEPDYQKEDIEDRIDLSLMAASVDKVLAGSQDAVISQLRIQGGSPGGARPKVTVALSEKSSVCLSGFKNIPNNYHHWLVKFRSQEDPMDMGCAEKTYAEMAALAGVEMPQTALQPIQVDGVDEQFFAVKRFDREGNERLHVITMAGLYYANFRTPCLDYKDVLAATSGLTKNKKQVERAFRLMAFNVLAHNKDDHAKNFAFIYRDKGWELSPAYDLTFSAGMGNEHTTAIAGSGNPGLSKLLEVATLFQIAKGAMIIEEVRHAVSQWPSLALNNEVSTSTINEVMRHLNEINTRF